jgi:hypothetical protein
MTEGTGPTSPADRRYTDALNGMDVLVILICLVTPSLVLSPWSQMANFTDFPEYYAAAKLFAAGHFRDVYDIQAIGHMQNMVYADLHGRTIPLFLLPTLAWCLVPLAWMPFQVSLVVWTCFLCAVLLIAFLLVDRMMSLSRRQRLWTAALLGTSGPCLECIRISQPGPLLLLGLTVWVYGMVNRKSLLSACGQAVFWLKPHILLPLMLFDAGTKSFGVLARTCILGAVGSIFALLVGGPSTFEAYFSEIASSPARVFMGSVTGPTFRGQLMRLKLPLTDGVIDAISYAAYALVLAGTFMLARRCSRLEQRLIVVFAVVIPLSLAFVTHLQNYDLLLLFPGLVAPFVLPSKAGRSRNVQRIVSALLILLLSLPVYIFVHYFYVLPGGLVNPFFIGTIIWGAVSLLALKDSSVSHAVEKE